MMQLTERGVQHGEHRSQQLSLRVDHFCGNGRNERTLIRMKTGLLPRPVGRRNPTRPRGDLHHPGSGSNETMATSILKLLAATVLIGFTSTPSAAESVPQELAHMVSQIHSAAVHRKYETLREHMNTEFVWSFGGDGDREQALSEWRKDARYLHRLARATRSACELIGGGAYQCPAKPGEGFRAGFRQIDGQWKMVYFVAGD